MVGGKLGFPAVAAVGVGVGVGEEESRVGAESRDTSSLAKEAMQCFKREATQDVELLRTCRIFQPKLRHHPIVDPLHLLLRLRLKRGGRHDDRVLERRTRYWPSG